VKHLAGLLLVLTAAGCQPSARRLLLVDFTYSDPMSLESTASPWHAAGYRIEYRRYYPHLTRHDLTRYRTIVILGGSEPEARSAALAIGDLATLTEWARNGGVVVLGYGPGELDRWMMNRWLASQGAGIAIGAPSVGAMATPLPRSALDNAGFAPFPAGRSRALVVRDQSQTLARSSTATPNDRPAVVAASRLRDGLIVLASRGTLAASGEDRKTRDFLVALARWTRRSAEWAAVAPAMDPVPLSLTAAPGPVAMHPPPLAPPEGAELIVLPPPAARADTARLAVPGWISRQGMRVLWSRFAPYALDSLLAFMDIAALNALATAVPVPALADSFGARNVWRVTAERLQATSLRWFPAVVVADIPSDGADELDEHGDLVAIPCALDSAYWRSGLRPITRALTRLGGARPDVIAGVALDLDGAATHFAGAGFCDADYRVGLAALGAPQAEVDELATLPPVSRYEVLLERGYLARYYAALEAAVAERTLTLRTELRRLHPELRFAIRASDAPADWFSLGLLRGLSSRDAPVLLWTRDRRLGDREVRARYLERGIFILSALGIAPPAPRALVFGEHDGFWLERATSDSIGRLIRRMTR
jgi:hypothetical protein